MVLIECRVEVHVFYLNSEDHVDLCVSGVGREAADAELDDSDRRNAEKDHVEEETVHPSLVLLHGVESAAKGQSDPEFNVPFLHTPHHEQTQISKDKSSYKAGIPSLQCDEELIEPGNEWSISCGILGDISEYSE